MHMVTRFVHTTALLCGMLAAPHVAAAQADLALVLAVDVSSSVNEDRFKLQREGLAAVLESREVLGAIASGPHQTIELAVLEWSEEQKVLVDWTIIRGETELNHLGQILRTTPRPLVGFKTDVGGAMEKAITLLDTVPLAADRTVIDVSGDGEQNAGKLRAEQMRDAAVAKDITINGLPITSGDESEVDRWYRAHVIGGVRAFLVVANGHDAFREAMRQKLVLEIADLTPPARLAAAR
jgi:hypothetical protein